MNDLTRQSTAPQPPDEGLPPHVRSVSTSDIEEQAAQLRGWQQHYSQLSSGAFRGEFQELELHGLDATPRVKADFEKRILAMIDYCENESECRSRQLLRYFGETESEDCCHCDICRARRKESSDEALRQAIGRQSSHGSVLRTREDPTTDDEPAPPPEAAASEACEPRRRRLRMPDYEQTFLCDHDVRHRSNLYASEEIKRKLLDVVQLLGRGNLSLTAYVDNILRHHLEFYREEINRLHKQRNSQNIL